MNLREEAKGWAAGDVIDLVGTSLSGDIKGVAKRVTLRNVMFEDGARLTGWQGTTFEDYTVKGTKKQGAGMACLRMTACADVTMKNGRIIGHPNLSRGGIRLDKNEDIRIENTDISGTMQGVVIGRSQRVTVTDTLLRGQTMDGFNVMTSSNVRIDGITARAFRTTPKDHADLVQIINDGTGTCADVYIGNVLAAIDAQGITLFDHDRGGADRVTVENVTLLVAYYHAVNLEKVRGLTLRNIRYGLLPGAKLKGKPWVKYEGSTDVTEENVAYLEAANVQG